jgi:hypothetical protein
MRTTSPTTRLLPVLAAVALAACASMGALLGDSVSFTAPQLQSYLDRRFPRDYEQLGGLVTLSVLNPRLSIPAGSDRLRLEFDIGFGALGSDSRTPSGRLALTSGLRYDPGTRGLHLDAPVLESADVPRLGGAMSGNGRELVNRWLADYAREEPVYQLDAGLLERIAARRIDATTIANGQVTVQLGQ